MFLVSGLLQGRDSIKTFSSTIFLPMIYGISSLMTMPVIFLEIWTDGNRNNNADDSTFKIAVSFRRKTPLKDITIFTNSASMMQWIHI
jgi:hypothetical protein